MVVLFDLNGTLTDPRAIGAVWDAPEVGIEVLAGAVQSAMVETILDAGSRPFRAHIEAALRDEVGRRGLDPVKLDQALEVATSLPAFEDADPALELLGGAGHALVVLTNSGADAGRRALESNGLAARFERILGVDAVGSFKPHPAVYRYALEEVDRDPRDVTFVSAHAWDLAGAAQAGMRTGFVMRDEPLASAYAKPDIAAADLRELARAMIG